MSMEVEEEIQFSTNTSNMDGDITMSDCSMSEAEDGELIDDRTEIPRASQSFPKGEIFIYQRENKLELRAKRFGIMPKENNFKFSGTDKVLNRVYKSMGVDSKTRLEALHLFGTDNMKTQDVFAYFENIPPASVEWITDKTCNAVWLDERSCVSALLSSSIRIKGHNVDAPENTESSDSSDDEECVRVEDLRLSLPPGIWRKGRTTPFATNVFLRFATRSDKRSYKRDALLLNPGDYVQSTNVIFPDEGDEGIRKLRSESDNPWADLARQWGHFEQTVGPKERGPLRDAREVIKNRELRDPIPKRDAREKISSDRDFLLETERNSEKTFGEMRADVEERKMLQKKCLKRRLKWVSADTDLREKLGHKRKRISLEVKKPWEKHSDDEGLVIEVENVKDRLGEGAWVAYDSADSSNESCDGDNTSSSSDLRHKLIKGTKSFVPRSPLRIEIDNDIYYSGNASDSDSS